MTGRKMVVLCVVVLIGCSVASAQQCDFTAVGQSMSDAAEQGDWDAAFTAAKQVLDAAPDDLTTLTAEEQYWVGIAHMYRMAQVLDMAKDGLQDEDQAAYAATVSGWVLINPFEDVVTISHGERVNLADHLVPGQTVIVDFTSEYCGPCVWMGPRVEALARERDDIALVKVDINRPGVQGIDWHSPVAQQYNLRGIPYFQIYGPDGGLLAEGQRARNTIEGWLAEIEG